MEYRRKVFGYECDLYGHLNNANYLHLFEEARADALDKMGLSVRKLNDLGFHIYITNLELTYKKGIPVEENIIIKSKIVTANRVSSIWRQEIYDNSYELCSTIKVKGVFVKDGKPYRISKELFNQFQEFIE